MSIKFECQLIVKLYTEIRNKSFPILFNTLNYIHRKIDMWRNNIFSRTWNCGKYGIYLNFRFFFLQFLILKIISSKMKSWNCFHLKKQLLYTFQIAFNFNFTFPATSTKKFKNFCHCKRLPKTVTNFFGCF